MNKKYIFVFVSVLLTSLLGFPFLNTNFNNTAHAAQEFYVSPAGSSSGNGSMASPWDLQTALNHPVSVKPGDIIWMRGGTYRGNYIGRLTGTATAPIIVRQYPGERATIDSGSNPNDALYVTGPNTWYWGFEIMSSDLKRRSNENGSFPTDIQRGRSVMSYAPNTRFINLVVHDSLLGPAAWVEAPNAEMYGIISYHNGWEGFTDRGHGHGIYTQNSYGTRLVQDVITFNNFSHGLHAYSGVPGYLNNITFDGNISFNNGALSIGGLGQARDYLLGGNDPHLTNNVAYRGQTNYGTYGGCSNGTMLNNYLTGIVKIENCRPVAMTGNTFVLNPLPNPSFNVPAVYPSNTYLNNITPTGLKTFIRANKYEPGRANIAIFNWNKNSSVNVDISASGLKIGDQFQIRDAQNFYGVPVVSGTYTGNQVSIPMVGLTLSPPIGNDLPVIPSHTGPEFGAFVVMPGSTVYSAPSPTPTPTPTSTSSPSTTPTATPTPIITLTPAPTVTSTPTFTPTVTATPVPNSIDNIRPVVSNVRVTNIGPYSATIMWDTNELADSQVVFPVGICPNTTNCKSPVDPTLTTSHAVNVSGLRPSARYTFQPWSRDASGNSGWYYYQEFTTSAGSTPTTTPTPVPTPVLIPTPIPTSTSSPSTTPTPIPTPTGTPSTDRIRPIISNLRVTVVGPYSATIMWDTNELADSQVVFPVGICPNTTNCKSPVDPTLTTSHVINLSSLMPSRLYTFQAWSRDASGNSGNSSYMDLRTTAPTSLGIGGSQVAGAQSSALPFLFTKNLSLGRDGGSADVVALQEFLRKDGHLSLLSTGIFGSLTREAVMRMQSKYGIASTGFVGQATRKLMNRLQGLE